MEISNQTRIKNAISRQNETKLRNFENEFCEMALIEYSLYEKQTKVKELVLLCYECIGAMPIVSEDEPYKSILFSHAENYYKGSITFAVAKSRIYTSKRIEIDCRIKKHIKIAEKIKICT